MHFVLPDGFQIQFARAGVVELGEVGDVMDVTSLCSGREATHLHVLDKPLFERCHFECPSDWNAVILNNRLPVWRNPRAHYHRPSANPPLWPLSIKSREAG